MRYVGGREGLKGEEGRGRSQHWLIVQTTPARKRGQSRRLLILIISSGSVSGFASLRQTSGVNPNGRSQGPDVCTSLDYRPKCVDLLWCAACRQCPCRELTKPQFKSPGNQINTQKNNK